MTTPQERTLYALRDLTTGAQALSFVRSFAYATGPAYGLLLDQASPGWLATFVATQDSESFDQRLSIALHLAPSDFSLLKQREAVYDAGGALRRSEVLRKEQKSAQLRIYKTTLVDGPVLLLPLLHPNFEFKPQSLVPLGNSGTVYPAINLRDTWGVLQVDDGGALMRPDEAAVTAVGFDPVRLQCDALKNSPAAKPFHHRRATAVTNSHSIQLQVALY